MDLVARISCSLFLGLAGATDAIAQSGGAVPALETILVRMAQARAENRTHLRPYRVTRTYRLFGKELTTAKSEVTADLTFVPPDVKRFAIKQAKGMALGESIVRQMLEHETGIVKNNESTDMSPANYSFRFLREELLNGQRFYVLAMVPWRKDKTLLSGTIWIHATTYRLHRIEGAPGKAPSWWLRDSRMVMYYGDAGGMWLQTGSESTANVRFVGKYTMRSHDVDYDFGKATAEVHGAGSNGVGSNGGARAR